MPQSPNGRSFLRAALLFEGGLIGLAVGLGWLFGTPPFSAQGLQFGWWPLLLGIAATILPVLALGWCLNSTHPHLVHLTEVVETTVGPLLRDTPVLALLGLSILAGIGEEALFRGVFQPALARLAGPVTALLVVSAVFGLVHYVTATYAVLAGLIGLYLGWLMVATENLLVPIIVHSLYDFVALSVLVSRAGRVGRKAGAEPGGIGIEGETPDS